MKKQSIQEVAAYLDRTLGRGWRSRCANEAGVNYGTVMNFLNGSTRNQKVYHWIKEAKEEADQMFI